MGVEPGSTKRRPADAEWRRSFLGEEPAPLLAAGPNDHAGAHKTSTLTSLPAKAERKRALGALFTAALLLGLRRGEALGLAWADVDLTVGCCAYARPCSGPGEPCASGR